MNRSISKLCQSIEKLGGRALLNNKDQIYRVLFMETSAGDAGAKLLQGLSDLTELVVDDSELTDRGMKYLEGLVGLRSLSIEAPRVTETGLTVIGGLINLESLEIAGARLTGSVFQALARLHRLSELGLTRSELEDDCLASIGPLPELINLRLNACKGVNSALPHLKQFTKLEKLNLAHSDVSDHSLVHLQRLPNLTDLDIGQAGFLTGAGLATLQELKKLRTLSADGISVAPKVMLKLYDNLPDCDLLGLPYDVSGILQERRSKEALARPKTPRPDLRAWTQRASSFVKELKHLGGQFENRELVVHEPVGREEIDRLNSTLANPLPNSLRAYFELAAGQASFKYNWQELPPDRLALLRQVLPNRNFLFGGCCLGPITRLAEYQDECRSFAEECWPVEFPKEQSEWQRAVPFFRMENADFIALDPKQDPDDPPVIYLSTDGANHLLARNFAAFLWEWERLAYIGCDIYLFEPFRDRRTGCLDSETAKAQSLRDVFSNPFRPIIIDPAWRTNNVVGLAVGIAADRAFDRLPILADALEDAGCDRPEILRHCREQGQHPANCWVVEMILGKK
jgi:hypothetical protein